MIGGNWRHKCYLQLSLLLTFNRQNFLKKKENAVFKMKAGPTVQNWQLFLLFYVHKLHIFNAMLQLHLSELELLNLHLSDQ